MAKLGLIDAVRFIGLELEHSRDDYTKFQDKVFEGMTVDEIYAEAVRLEAERGKRRGAER